MKNTDQYGDLSYNVVKLPEDGSLLLKRGSLHMK
jgi:hypothetical protein